MKKLLVVLLVIVSLSSHAQVVEMNFIHLKNDELKTALKDALPRFTHSLTGFNALDSISINYDMNRNSVFIMHNVNSPEKINRMYMAFLMHCAFLKSVYPSRRLEFTKILVQHDNDKFLEADYSDLVYMTGTRKAKWYIANYNKPIKRS